MNIATTLAAIRHLESEDNYLATKTYPGNVVGLGAYQITRQDWEIWSSDAGIPGADWRSPEAQDRVAARAVANMHARYGDWELVALAWFGGSNIADEVARTRTPIDEIPFMTSREYVQNFRQIMSEIPQVPDSTLGNIPQPNGSGWLMPVAGENNWKASEYLYRRSAAQIAAGRSPVHEGIDIFAAKGTPIVAPVSGVVTGSYSDVGGYWFKIKGDDGIEYYGAHMASELRVASGTRVSQGHHIGFVGNSGNASDTKPHLHFTMKHQSNRELINPAPYLGGAGTANGTYVQNVDSLGDIEDEIPMNNQAGYMTDFFGAMGNNIAGGDRGDYRTFTDEMLESERDPDNITLDET